MPPTILERLINAVMEITEAEATTIPVGCPLFNSGQSEWETTIGELKFTAFKRSATDYYEDDTANSIWGAAWSFAQYMLQNPTFFAGAKLVELGSGTGVGGLAAACAGCTSVHLTDLPDNLDILKATVKSNLKVLPKSTNITVDALRWGAACSTNEDEKDIQGEHYDVVLAVDCIYCHTLHEILAETAVRVCKEPSGHIFIADEHRWNDSEQWWAETAKRYGLVLVSTIELPRHEKIPRGIFLREYVVDRKISRQRVEHEAAAALLTKNSWKWGEGEEEDEDEEVVEKEEVDV